MGGAVVVVAAVVVALVAVVGMGVVGCVHGAGPRLQSVQVRAPLTNPDSTRQNMCHANNDVQERP